MEQSFDLPIGATGSRRGGNTTVQKNNHQGISQPNVSNKRHFFCRVISILLSVAILFTLFACQKQSTEDQDGRNRDVEGTLTDFFIYLNSHEYNSAYGLLTSNAQSQINPVSFAALYSNFFNLMKVTDISATTSSSRTDAQRNVSSVSFHFQNNLGQDIDNYQRITLIQEDEQWKIDWTPSLIHPDLSWDDHIVSRTLPASRGEIFASGQVVAANQPGISVYITPADIEDREAMIAELSPLIGMDADVLRKRLSASILQAQVTSEKLRLRDQPSTSDSLSNVIITLGQGEILTILDDGALTPSLADPSEEVPSQSLLVTPSPLVLDESPSPTENITQEDEPDDGFYHVEYVQSIVAVDDTVLEPMTASEVIAAKESVVSTPAPIPTLPPTVDPVTTEEEKAAETQEEALPTTMPTQEPLAQPTEEPEIMIDIEDGVATPAPEAVVTDGGRTTITLEGYVYAPYVRTRYSQDLMLIKTFKNEQLDRSTIDQINAIPGVNVDESTLASYRYYPYGASMFHLLGYTGIISEEALEEHLAECKTLNVSPRYNSDSRVGKTGLEKQYEDVLRGQDGYEIYIANGDGVSKTSLYRREASSGLDIHLSIDPGLQKLSYDMLRLYLTDDQGGAVVCTDPTTGAVLSMVSYPSVDPNTLATMSAAEYKLNITDNKLSPLFDRTINSSYTPGSIFKSFTAVMGLENTEVTTGTPFPYEKDIVKNRWDPRDSGWSSWHWPAIKRIDSFYDECSFYTAMKKSDNIYFAWLATRIGQETFWNYCVDKLGFYEDIPFDLPVKSANIFKPYGVYQAFNTKFLADSGYGQGQLTMTPLHASAIFGAFPNGGDAMRPYVVESLKHTEGLEYVTDLSVTPTVWKQSVITDPSVLSAVDEGMRMAMQADGTGSPTVAPYPLAGKTGTAEIIVMRDNVVNGQTILKADGTAEQIAVREELAWLTAYKANDPKDFLASVVIECQQREGKARFPILSALFQYDGTSDNSSITLSDLDNELNGQSIENIDPSAAVSVLEEGASSGDVINAPPADDSANNDLPDISEEGSSSDASSELPELPDAD